MSYQSLFFDRHHCADMVMSNQDSSSPSSDVRPCANVVRGVALHDQGVALATPKNTLFFNWLVYSYIRLPQIKNFELPQTNLVVKN